MTGTWHFENDSIGIRKAEVGTFGNNAYVVACLKTATSIIVDAAADADRVLSIWRQRPDLDLGVHLTLTSEWGERYGWSPVLPRGEVPSLYNPEGLMWPTEDALRVTEIALKTRRAADEKRRLEL